MSVFWSGFLAGILSTLLPSLTLLAWHATRACEPVDAEMPATRLPERV